MSEIVVLRRLFKLEVYVDSFLGMHSKAFDRRNRRKEPVSLAFYPFGHAHYVKMTYLV